MIVRIKSNERDLPTSIEFEVQDKLYISRKQEETTESQILRALYRHGDAVTYKALEQLSGIKRGTATGILPNHHWFQRVDEGAREHEFWLSDAGSAAAQMMEEGYDVIT